MAHEDGVFDLERVEERHQISGQLRQPVGVDGTRSAAPAIAALVWRNRTEARSGHRGELMSP